MLPTSLTLVKLALRGRLRNTRLRLRSTGQLLSVFLQILEWWDSFFLPETSDCSSSIKFSSLASSSASWSCNLASNSLLALRSAINSRSLDWRGRRSLGGFIFNLARWRVTIRTMLYIFWKTVLVNNLFFADQNTYSALQAIALYSQPCQELNWDTNKNVLSIVT